MRKRLLVAVSVMLVLISVFFVGCSNQKDRDIYPKWVYENAWENEQEELEMPEQANLRIMSYNILVEAWNSNIKTGISNPFSARVEQVGKIINHYSPDVVGLQEVCGKWHNNLSKEIKDNYKFVESVDGIHEYTSMIYNYNKVDCVECGKVPYTKRSEKKMRYIAWALFKSKSNNKQFIVTNTHFDFGEEKKDIQTKQMEEYGNYARELKQKYNVPIFLVGDYNAYEVEIQDKKSELYSSFQGVELYEKFAEDNKQDFVDANYIEQVEKFGGKHCDYDEPKWDHIFISSDITAYKYVMLSNDFYTSASDHFPVFIDVAI